MTRPTAIFAAEWAAADAADPLQFVTVKGGLIFPVAAVALALELSMRGIPLVVDSELDRAAIARWRRHLAAIVLYECPADERPEGWPR